MKKTKKIILISPAYYPDIRTAKFIKSFIESGFKVYILRYRKRESDMYDDILKEYRSKIVVYDIKSLFSTPNIPFNIIRDKKVRNYIKKIKPDIVFCRDIFLSTFINKKIKRSFPDTIFILDICDNYPEIVGIFLRGVFRKLGVSILNYVEKRALKLFDHVIFVSEHSCKYVLAKHNVTKNIKYSIIYNMPLKSSFIPKFSSRDKYRKGLVYIGTVDKGIRDLDTVIRAISHIKNSYNMKIKFDVYYFRDDLAIINYYKQLCSFLNIEDLVNFMEAIPHAQLYDTLNKYVIGVIPHVRNPGVDFTIPNKLFDYAASGLYILSSDNPALVEVINNFNLGKVYIGGDFVDCAHKIIEILNEYYSNYDKKPRFEDFYWEKYFGSFFYKLEDNLKDKIRSTQG